MNLILILKNFLSKSLNKCILHLKMEKPKNDFLGKKRYEGSSDRREEDETNSKHDSIDIKENSDINL